MGKLTPADRELMERLDAAGVPRAHIARRLDVTGAYISQTLGPRNPERNIATRIVPHECRIPVPALASNEVAVGGRDPYAGRSMTWWCPSVEAARVMEAIFAGRFDEVPSRRAFAPMPWAGLAAQMALDLAVGS